MIALAVAGLALAAAGASAPPPAIRAKQARAQAVLAQVDRLDTRFGKIVDAWDGARIQLAATQKALARNEIDLRAATRQSRTADERLARRLVTIYEGGRPTTVDVLAGVSRLSDVLDLVEATNAIMASDRQVAGRARRSRQRLAAARSQLQATRRTRAAAVGELAAERRQIGAMLSQRRQLLASVRSEIATLQRQEEARQRALAAAARARLAAQEAAARKAAEAAARARAAQEAAQAKAAQEAARAQAAQEAATVPAAPAPAPTTTAATPAATAAVTTSAPAPTDPAPATTATAVPPPAATPGAGHPEAASIALHYLGVPYKWGGASPSEGFDCSGLVMYVYAQIGIQLPHQAAAQFGYGAPVPRDQLQPGDLVFFDGLSHVAIYIGNGEVVHAPHTGAVVEIAPLSNWTDYDGARRP